MPTFFIINNQKEEGTQGIKGLYTSLNAIYQKMLDFQFINPNEFKDYELSCVSQEGNVTPLITAELFVKIMKSIENEPDVDALRKLFADKPKEELIVAFLQCIISPEGTGPSVEQRLNYIRVLRACEIVLKDEHNSLYLDIVRAGIKMYSAEDV